jgi:hypothetical protein
MYHVVKCLKHPVDLKTTSLVIYKAFVEYLNVFLTSYSYCNRTKQVKQILFLFANILLFQNIWYHYSLFSITMWKNQLRSDHRPLMFSLTSQSEYMARSILGSKMYIYIFVLKSRCNKWLWIDMAVWKKPILNKYMRSV